MENTDLGSNSERLALQVEKYEREFGTPYLLQSFE
jgi:hypothetical protein